MYSDMSMRVIARSSSNRKLATAFTSSVLPTPVGPRNRKEPMGRLGSCNPARARRTALLTASSASSWPTTRRRSSSSIRSSLARSPSSIFSTGMPVHRLTTPAMPSSVTASFTSRAPSPAASASFFSMPGMVP